MKICKVCGESKSKKEYHKASTNSDGLRTTCNECRSILQKSKRNDVTRDCERKSYRKHKDKNNERSFIFNVKSRYGISIEEYDKAMETSNVCEHCGSTNTLCYDHDHSGTHDIRAFRGVLCRTCNSALGQLGDTFEDIERMYKYLKRYEDKKNV